MRTRRFVLWLSILVLFVASCASGPQGSSRRRSLLIDEDWIVVESANFEIFSTLSREDTVELAKELELFRAVVFATTNARQAPPPIPTKIFAFERKRHYNRYASSDSAGLFVPGLRFNTVLVSEFRVVERSALSVIFHEYVHFVVINGSSSLYPIWYNEGFPEFPVLRDAETTSSSSEACREFGYPRFVRDTGFRFARSSRRRATTR